MDLGSVARSIEAEWIRQVPHQPLQRKARPVVPAYDSFYRPSAGFEPGAERYRLLAPSGALAAIATDAGTGRLAPDKVLVSAEAVA